MHHLVCISIFFVLFLGLSTEAPTTLNLEEIFIGRCYDYSLTKSGNDKPLPGVQTNCTTLWILFKSAFIYKPSCGLNYDSYFPFLEAAQQDLPANKSLFWSGTYDYVHRLSQVGDDYVTLEDTLSGYLVDRLFWCGKETNPGMDFLTCPNWDECEGHSNSAFWEASSEFFAKEAEGEVFVLLDGSNPDRLAYRNTSMFSTVELQNLNTSRVSTVNVMLMHLFGQPKVETCISGSILDLQKDVLARNLIFKCQENPGPVFHMLCADDPSYKACKRDEEHDSGNGSSSLEKSLYTETFIPVFFSVYKIYTYLRSGLC